VTTPLYDAFSTDYDRFVRWDRRLANELPFIEAQLASVGARRVLDVAAGTGRHAIALAQRGYQVIGADVSAGMVQQARTNAKGAGLDLPFVQAGFGQVAASDVGTFDAVLCLGSSLPHVQSLDALGPALQDFASVLRSDGLLLVQNRNFDRVLAEESRWMPPQSAREGDTEWLFLRFYDFGADGSLAFNVVTLVRKGELAWQQQASSTTLWPLRQRDLSAALQRTGFDHLVLYGDMQGSCFDVARSPNLIVSARRSSSG
jgi:SAM-dependent methyltransferase